MAYIYKRNCLYKATWNISMPQCVLQPDILKINIYILVQVVDTQWNSNLSDSLNGLRSECVTDHDCLTLKTKAIRYVITSETTRQKTRRQIPKLCRSISVCISEYITYNNKPEGTRNGSLYLCTDTDDIHGYPCICVQILMISTDIPVSVSRNWWYPRISQYLCADTDGIHGYPCICVQILTISTDIPVSVCRYWRYPRIVSLQTDTRKRSVRYKFETVTCEPDVSLDTGDFSWKHLWGTYFGVYMHTHMMSALVLIHLCI